MIIKRSGKKISQISRLIAIYNTSAAMKNPKRSKKSSFREDFRDTVGAKELEPLTVSSSQ
jgi:uracil-DNA glycosylase